MGQTLSMITLYVLCYFSWLAWFLLIPHALARCMQYVAVSASACILRCSVRVRKTGCSVSPRLLPEALCSRPVNSTLLAICHMSRTSLETLPSACPQWTETNNKTKQRSVCCRRKSTHVCRSMCPGEIGVKGNCKGDRQNGKAPRSRRKTWMWPGWQGERCEGLEHFQEDMTSQTSWVRVSFCTVLHCRLLLCGGITNTS